MHVEVPTNVHVMIPRQQYGWRAGKKEPSIFMIALFIFVIRFHLVYSWYSYQEKNIQINLL